MARRVLLFLGTLSFGLVVKVAVFDIGQYENRQLWWLYPVLIPVGTLLFLMGLRRPTGYLQRTTADPDLPPARVPRWRRAPDRLPVGAWILIPFLTPWAAVPLLMILAGFSSLLGPWPVIGVIFAIFALGYSRRKIPDRRGGTAALPVGALILVPFLVAASVFCVGFMVSLVAGALLG